MRKAERDVVHKTHRVAARMGRPLRGLGDDHAAVVLGLACGSPRARFGRLLRRLDAEWHFLGMMVPPFPQGSLTLALGYIRTPAPRALRGRTFPKWSRPGRYSHARFAGLMRKRIRLAPDGFVRGMRAHAGFVWKGGDVKPGYASAFGVNSL